jgi:hypothetical protein
MCRYENIHDGMKFYFFGMKINGLFEMCQLHTIAYYEVDCFLLMQL